MELYTLHLRGSHEIPNLTLLQVDTAHQTSHLTACPSLPLHYRPYTIQTGPSLAPFITGTPLAEKTSIWSNIMILDSHSVG